MPPSNLNSPTVEQARTVYHISMKPHLGAGKVRTLAVSTPCPINVPHYRLQLFAKDRYS